MDSVREDQWSLVTVRVSLCFPTKTEDQSLEQTASIKNTGLTSKRMRDGLFWGQIAEIIAWEHTLNCLRYVQAR